MAKKKRKLSPEEEKQKKLEKLSIVYEEVINELGIDNNLSMIEQVHSLVDAADNLMSEICSVSDDIKINDLTKVQELTPIDKKTYLDFVNICALKNNDKLKDKAISKFENDFSKRLFITNLRHSFLETYMSDKDLKITDENNEEYKPFTDYKSEEFDKIMQDSAKKREYLNCVLWKQYKKLSQAAEYITNLELSYKDFKNLVDWQHYKDGGYPNSNSPSKIWSIYDRFNYAYKTLSKWGYESTSADLEYEFGLNILQAEEHPIQHSWMIEEKEID